MRFFSLSPTARFIIALLLIAGFLFYGIFRVYAYTDVYEFLYHADRDQFIHVFVQGGRLFYGILNKCLLVETPSVQALSWLRLFGVVGLILAAIVLYHVLKRYLFDSLTAGLCALFFMLTPSASITGVWVATYQVGWGLAIALLAGCFATEFFQTSGWKKRLGFLLLAIALGVFSLMTYQPTYTAFIIPQLLLFLRAPAWKKTIGFFAVYFFIYIVYYAVHLTILDVFNLNALSRTGVTDEPFRKLQWFFRWPLKMVLEGNFIFYRNGWLKLVAVVFSAVSLAGVFAVIRTQTNAVRVIVIIGLGVFLFGTYIPNLISSDNWVSYRTLSTLYIFTLVLFFSGVTWLQQNFRYTNALTVALGILMVGNAWYNITRGFTDLQTREYAAVRMEVMRLIPELKHKEKLLFIMPSFDFVVREGLVRRVVSDEFGSLSSSRDWVPMPMVKQILREAGEKELEQNIKVIGVPDMMQLDSVDYHDGVVLHVGELFKAQDTGTPKEEL